MRRISGRWMKMNEEKEELKGGMGSRRVGLDDRLSRNKVVREGGRKTSWKICERSVKRYRDRRGNGGTWRTGEWAGMTNCPDKK